MLVPAGPPSEAVLRLRSKPLKSFCRDTYIECSQQEQGGLQTHREDQAQDGGSYQSPNAVRLRQDDDDGQGEQHGQPQEGRQVGLQGTWGVVQGGRLMWAHGQ